mgnify:CR=1 FL=1
MVPELVQQLSAPLAVAAPRRQWERKPEPLYCLACSIVECKELKKANVFGKNDVYVVLELGGEKQRTTTVEGTDKVGSNPKWGNGYGESKIFDRSVRPNQRTSVRNQ